MTRSSLRSACSAAVAIAMLAGLPVAALAADHAAGTPVVSQSAGQFAIALPGGKAFHTTDNKITNAKMIPVAGTTIARRDVARATAGWRIHKPLRDRA
jgi:hypothetical protein